MNKEREVTCLLCSDLEHSADQGHEPDYMQPLTAVRYTDETKLVFFLVCHEGEVYEVKARHLRKATTKEKQDLGYIEKETHGTKSATKPKAPR